MTKAERRSPDNPIPTYFMIKPVLHVGLTEAGAENSRRTAMDPNLLKNNYF